MFKSSIKKKANASSGELVGSVSPPGDELVEPFEPAGAVQRSHIKTLADFFILGIVSSVAIYPNIVSSKIII